MFFIAPRLGATVAASRGNAELRQEPPHEEHPSGEKSDYPKPVGHVCTSIVVPIQAVGR